MEKYILAYLCAVNLLAFALYGIDKRKAIKHRYRISERTLLGAAAVGGSVGALLGMYLFRHKTKHFRFVIGVPLMIAVQAIIAFLVLKARL